MLLFGKRKKANRKAGKPSVSPPRSSGSEDDCDSSSRSQLDVSEHDNSTLHDDSIYTSATPMVKPAKLHLSHMNLLDTVPSLPPLPASMLINNNELVDDDFLQLPESLQITTAMTNKHLSSSPLPTKLKDGEVNNKESPTSVMDVPASCESGVNYQSPSKWSHLPNNVTPEDLLNMMRKSRYAQDTMLVGTKQVIGMPPSAGPGRKDTRLLPNTPESSKTMATTNITPESSVDGLVKSLQQSSMEEKSTHSKASNTQQGCSLSCETPKKKPNATSRLESASSPCIKMTSIVAGTGPQTLPFPSASVTSHEDDFASSKGTPSRGETSAKLHTPVKANGQESKSASSVEELQKQEEEDSVAQDQSVEVISVLTPGPGAVLLTKNTLKFHEHELPVVYGSKAALSYVKKRTEDDDDDTFYDAKDEHYDISEMFHYLTENDLLKHEVAMNVHDSGAKESVMNAPFASSEGLKGLANSKLVAANQDFKNKSKFCSIWCFRKRRMDPESDLTGFSVAPLNICSEIPTQIVPQKEKNRRLLWRWAKRASLQQKVSRWLEKERKRVLASCREMEQAEKPEKQRIEEMKNQELQRQRLREKNMREARMCSHQRDSPALPPITSIILREEDVSTIGESAQFHQHQLPGFSVAKLPLCLICREGKRTHIAVPCMHFSFCSSCVEQMRQRGYEKCPACGLDKVHFAKVALEDNKDSASFHI